MMTQADIIAKNSEIYSTNAAFNIEVDRPTSSPFLASNVHNDDQSENKSDLKKPTNFGDGQFNIFSSSAILNGLNENSPIRPSKYFATDSALNTSKGLRNIILGGMIFSLTVTVALIVQISLGTTQVPYQVGIVTQEKICSDIGVDMVRQGGNSIDAFIASSICLSVLNPFSAGIGAGGFLLVRDHKHNKTSAINCFFKSSEKLNLEEYESNPKTGIKSIAIPGELKCLQAAYHKYARFYWKTLTDPSIKLARNGFPVSKFLAEKLKDLDLNDIKQNEMLSAMYLDSNGQLVQENAIIKNPWLADTLSLLSQKEYIFYNDGEVGLQTINELTEKKQTDAGEKIREQITVDDLRNYATQQEKTVIRSKYNDFVLLTASFPSSGWILNFVVEVMNLLPIQIPDFSTPELYNRLLEAIRLGYLMFSYVGDSEYDPSVISIFREKFAAAKSYFNASLSGSKDNLTSPFDKMDSSIYNLNDSLVLNFVSVNDNNDLMVSYVGTLGSAWGSSYITKKGFFLNNGLSLFSYKNDENYVELNAVNSNKQPRGLMSPILTYNEKNPCIRRFSISYGHHGNATDDYALSELSQVILKLFTDFSFYDTAISDKRVQYSFPSKVCYEDGFDNQIETKINNINEFSATNSCMFHSIDLVMKKDHIVYSKSDNIRSNDAASLLK